MSDLIKQILEDLITSGEADKIINYKGYLRKERKEAELYIKKIKAYMNAGYDIKSLSVIPIIYQMPRLITISVLNELLNYEPKKRK